MLQRIDFIDTKSQWLKCFNANSYLLGYFFIIIIDLMGGETNIC